jgi:hypothetical protein
MIACIHICIVPTVEKLRSTAWVCGKGDVDNAEKTVEKWKRCLKVCGWRD